MANTGVLNLSAFNNAEIIELERNDERVRGIFIPINKNGLYQCKRGHIKCFFSILDCKPNTYGFSHYIRTYTSKERRLELLRQGYKMPIIGNIGQHGAHVQRNIEDVL